MENLSKVFHAWVGTALVVLKNIFHTYEYDINVEIVKFGGSSLATETTIKLCAEITKASPKHQVIVVSAPGKYGIYQTKVTDDLIKVTQGQPLLDNVIERFNDIASKLLPPEQYQLFKITLHRTKNEILDQIADRDFVVSRGEYLSAKLFALYLGYNFIDAKDILVINSDTTVNLRATAQRIQRNKLKQKLPFVIGGFYGQRAGKIALLSRGGSDYTGAVLAALMRASLYKNYTDSHGIQTADPRLVYNTQTINCLDFDSLDILTHNGAGIIHENVAEVLKNYRVPLRVDNTFCPDQLYTEVHSLRCRHCQEDFFCITHRDNRILIVTKQHGNPVTTQTINSTPETLVRDMQKLHLEMMNKSQNVSV